MESIRSSLAELVHGDPVVLDSQDSDLDSEDSDLAQFDWNPPIPYEKFEMTCSNQLCDGLREAHYEKEK